MPDLNMRPARFLTEALAGESGWVFGNSLAELEPGTTIVARVDGAYRLGLMYKRGTTKAHVRLPSPRYEGMVIPVNPEDVAVSSSSGAYWGDAMDGQVLLDFFVDGHPRPKGSLKPRRVGRQLKLVEQSEYSKPWLEKVAKHAVVAQKYQNENGIYFSKELPFELSCYFTFERPESCASSIPGTGQHVGDLDKLVRNVSDALTRAGVIGDDDQIVEHGRMVKRWARPGTMPGARIILRDVV